MSYSYNKIYLSDAQRNLACMLDYAVHSLGYELAFFYNMFLDSSVADRFSYGDASIVAGKSGIELAKLVVYEHTNTECDTKQVSRFEKSEDYWTGWAMAYYQWFCGDDFKKINEDISIEDIRDMYYPYHEMNVSSVVDCINEKRSMQRTMTYLKKLRQKAGLSQRELAEQTQIPIKTIQQYEQRQKNINKAQVDYVIRLSRALGCKVEDLIEIQ